MSGAPYRMAHVSEIVTPAGSRPGEAAWRAVRMHFGISSFGIAAYAAEAAGDVLSDEHTEIDDSGTKHEELFFVAAGRAAVKVGDETVEARAGTFIHVPDPAVVRGATALEPGTTLIAVGGEPGTAFAVSPWERKYVTDE
jgi:hypothetical protein